MKKKTNRKLPAIKKPALKMKVGALVSFKHFSKLKSVWVRIWNHDLPWIILLMIISAVLLVPSIKGKLDPEGNLLYQDVKTTEPGSPFESTNTASRYALVEALVENKSLELTLEQARLAAPDLVYHDGKFFTLFNPGISILAAPFYMLGKTYGLTQIFTFLSTMLFAILNNVIIYVLARRHLHLSRPASILAGLIFLFATNAHTYAQTLTQHHGSTFVILLGVWCAVQTKRLFFRNILFGILCGVGLLFDFPNLFLLTPAGLSILSQHINFETTLTKIKLRFKLHFVFIALGMLPLLFAYGMYNKLTVGSPTTIAQFLGRSDYFDTEEKKLEHRLQAEKHDEYEATLPFYMRLQLNGLYILLISNERSWLYFSPVLLVSILGAFVACKDHQQRRTAVLLISVITTNILIYSAFGDPWGGWSFGARYLIPSAALASLLVAVAVDRYRRNSLFVSAFLPVLVFSIWISTAGAITSAAVPPRPESIQFVEYIPYTHDFNFKFLLEKGSSSLLYNARWADTLSGRAYHQYFSLVLITILSSFVVVPFLMSLPSQLKNIKLKK